MSPKKQIMLDDDNCHEDKQGRGSDWKGAALMRVVREDSLEEVTLS